MKHEKKYIRIIFLASVLLLVVNDWFLKSIYRNEITGKLSDICGLFAFPYFLSLLFPKNLKINYLLTGLFFIIWKSELIQPIIDFVQSMGIGINRTIDYSDLFTLSVLPISYYYWKSEFNDVFTNRINLKPITISLCCFAFIATSLPKAYKSIKMKSNLEIILKENKQNIISKLQLTKNDAGNYSLTFKLEEYKTEIRTTVLLKKLDNGMVSVKLDSIYDLEIRGGFFGVSENDSKALNKFTIKDYEKLFLEKEILKLYQN